MSYEHTISANTIFHFTNSLDNLESILKDEFCPRYCLENWAVIFTKETGIQEMAIPLVSFCDIPLSQIKKHTATYGHYAIGLTKEWGIKNNICPVFYTYKPSNLSSYLQDTLISLVKLKKSIEESKKQEVDNILHYLFKFIKYLKLYEGFLWRDGKYTKKKIRFYDEREWRFCPNIKIADESQTDEPKNFLMKDSFMKADKIKSENKKLEKYKLSFEPKDIKYIIVEKKDEILEMIRKITDIKRKYGYEDVEILKTRIISMEHIFEDF